MSAPSAGNYYIVNNVTPPGGLQLAINYNGVGQPLTVTGLENLPTQVWSITNNDGVTQFVGPSEAPNLQVNFDGNALAPDSPNGYYWVIRGDSELYTFQDAGYTRFWWLEDAALGQVVYTTLDGSGDAKEYWQLIPA